MRKRLFCVLLSVLLVCGVCPGAVAAPWEHVEAAYALYQLGLFQGTGSDAQGNPNFALDRAPTRYEAVTMLVRLLGKENEALSGNWQIPFTDVTTWARPYVGYAYANKLTSGTSATTFGGQGLVTPAQYITFVLRALGYESGADFDWSKAWELSDKLGLTEGRYNAHTTPFTRGDVARISHDALSITPKNKNSALVNFLDVKDHAHNYISKTTKRLEQVQTGTQTVVQYEYVYVYECDHCKKFTQDYEKFQAHIGPGGPCGGYGYMIRQKRQPVGITEEPVYESKWVDETMRVCAICGQHY